jgi:hypothetical protein
MAEAQTGTLVLRDDEGNYFLVPQETVEKGRVPAEQKAEIERLIGEQEDVQGHIWHALFTPLAVIVVGTVLVVREVNQQNTVGQAPLPGPGGIPTGSPETISTGGGPQKI